MNAMQYVTLEKGQTYPELIRLPQVESFAITDNLVFVDVIRHAAEAMSETDPRRKIYTVWLHKSIRPPLSWQILVLVTAGDVKLLRSDRFIENLKKWKQCVKGLLQFELQKKFRTIDGAKIDTQNDEKTIILTTYDMAGLKEDLRLSPSDPEFITFADWVESCCSAL